MKNLQHQLERQDKEFMAEQDSMETTNTRMKWTWIGHTMRKAGSSIMKQEAKLSLG